MDFDIGNILYIVIMLVAVIVSLLGKKKKPAQGGSEEPAGKARPSFMENLERVLTMDQEQSQIKDLQDFEEDLPVEEFPSEEPVQEARPEAMKGPTLMEEYERIMNVNRELDPDALEVIDLDELQGTDYFEIIRDFDAGTAVVYSAIINRLDY